MQDPSKLWALVALVLHQWCQPFSGFSKHKFPEKCEEGIPPGDRRCESRACGPVTAASKGCPEGNPLGNKAKTLSRCVKVPSLSHRVDQSWSCSTSREVRTPVYLKLILLFPVMVAISFSNAWKWKVKVKSLSRVWLLATPWTAAYQASPSMGFSRQEYWSGLPSPSPIYNACTSRLFFT